MKSKVNYFILVICILIMDACSTGKSTTSKTFNDDTASHKRIAVVPIQSTIKLKDKQKEKVSQADLSKIELNQAKEVQNAIESYLLSKNLRVSIQSSSMTNSKLANNKIDLNKVNEIDPVKLSKILGVDAIVMGEIETEQPMSEELARGLDVAKVLERKIVGTGFLNAGVNTSTNKGWCSLSLFEGNQGDRLWTYRNDLEMGAGSSVKDIIENLMKNGAKKFPYKK